MSSRPDGGARPRSLIERAAEVYDFSAALRQRETADVPPRAEPLSPEITPPAPVAPIDGRIHGLNHDALRAHGYMDPQGAATGLSEEFRIVKRQILAQQATVQDAQGRLILINSAHPGDGKTWVAINLALSLTAEADLEVLLVDADFGNPSICRQMGVPVQPGLMDALVDPAIDVETLVVRTDVAGLSILPAGRQVNHDTEVLASNRARAILCGLAERNPRRIVLLDSPPALAASAASELARHAGMVLMVVRADRTSDIALRDAVHLLSACPNIHALLNGVKFSSSGRLFGAYYGKRI